MESINQLREKRDQRIKSEAKDMFLKMGAEKSCDVIDNTLENLNHQIDKWNRVKEEINRLENL